MSTENINPNFVTSGINYYGGIESGYISFEYIENNYRCCAELSLVTDEQNTSFWFFNRLYVHEKLRSKNIGTRLIQTVVKCSMELNLTIFWGLNPYGDLNYKELKAFGIRNGFTDGGNYLFLGNPKNLPKEIF